MALSAYAGVDGTAGTIQAALEPILKDYYLGPVVQQLNNEVFLLSRLESTSENLYGRQAIIPLHTARTSGISARPEGAKIGDPGAQSYALLKYHLKYLYGRARVTGQAVLKTDNDAGAFLKAVESELDGLRDDTKKDLARQVYGAVGTGAANAPVGAIAQLTAATTGTTTITLSTPEPIVKGWIYNGMVVDIGTNADAASQAINRIVSACDPAAGTFVVSGANVTQSTSHYVFRGGNALADPTASGTISRNEVTGLNKLVNTGSAFSASADYLPVGELQPSTNPIWDNLRTPAVGALSQDILMQNFNKVRQAGGNVSLMLTTFGIQRAFFNLLQSQVRYTEPTTLKGGFQSLEFMGKPFVADVDAPYGQIYLLDERFMKVFAANDWAFLNKDGLTMRQVADYDAWDITLYRYMQLGITRRNVQCVLSGVTDPGF